MGQELQNGKNTAQQSGIMRFELFSSEPDLGARNLLYQGV
jgi:hypothetical protein